MSVVRDEFSAAYSAAFHEYVSGAAAEQGLEQAYELGRKAVTEGLSMLDIAAVHLESTAEALALASSPDEHARVARAAIEFAIESLSPFEMAQRGFREAQEAARLEQRYSTRLQRLADAALAIAGARAVDDVARLVTQHALEIVGARRAAASLGSAEEWGRVTETVAELDGPIRRRERRGRPPLLQAVCDAGELVRLTREELEAHPAWSRQDPPAGTASFLAIPLADRSGRNIGLIHLSDKREGAFSPNDEAILVQLSQIASVAIENVWLYEHEHDISQTLQRSLLPPSLPDIPGVAVSARFRPAGEGYEVGGDFYDIFETGEDRWGIAVGDVCGKGAAAATVTALARYTLRATALHEREPGRILAVLNEALLQHAPDQRFCTVTYAAFEPGRRRLRLASGGHPPPLLLRGGEVRPLGAAGTVLGILDDPQLTVEEVELMQGDTVLFHTDGVTDARAPARILSQEDLAAALAECQGLTPPEVAASIEALALAGGEGPPRDDIAIVVLALEGGASSRHVEAAGRANLTLELPTSPHSAGAARDALMPLAERLSEEELETVRLLVTELISNSVKHGETHEEPVTAKVSVTPWLVRVEVKNAGSGFEPPPPPTRSAERPSGWGLYLVDRLTARWGVDSTEGTSVWFEIERRPDPDAVR